MIAELMMVATMSWTSGRTIYSGQDLIDACLGRDLIGLTLCKGYIDATISTAMMYRAVSYDEHKTPVDQQADMICPPGKSLSQTQETAAISLYVLTHPDAATMHAPLVIVNGLTAAYPCLK
jgi:hypothetical protein